MIGYLFVLPALIYMLAVIGYPIVYNFILSFQDVTAFTIGSPERPLVGLQNYRAVFKEEIMVIAIKNTLFYTILCICFQFTLGFAFAIFFNQKFHLAKPIRGIIVVSWIIPITVTALVFKYMLNSEGGVIDGVLIKLGILSKPVGWLLHRETAMWGPIIANTWIGVPFNMLLLATGLAGIPEELYESASIDGANGFQRFVHITLPLLKPAIMAVLILGFVYTFKVFDLIYVMTSGGPVNATEVLSTYSYLKSFVTYNFSQGAAVANVLFVCLFSVAVLYLRMIGKDEVA
ncbi:MAG: sugar ABC transporter permease [Treponemataceae bacterium]